MLCFFTSYSPTVLSYVWLPVLSSALFIALYCRVFCPMNDCNAMVLHVLGEEGGIINEHSVYTNISRMWCYENTKKKNHGQQTFLSYLLMRNGRSGIQWTHQFHSSCGSWWESCDPLGWKKSLADCEPEWLNIWLFILRSFDGNMKDSE